MQTYAKINTENIQQGLTVCSISNDFWNAFDRVIKYLSNRGYISNKCRVVLD